MRYMIIVAASAIATAFAAPAAAQMPSMSGMPGMGMPFKDLLSRASDQALDKLSKPGAFQADDAIRIGLPGPAQGLGGVLGLAGKAGVGGGLTEGINSAAGQAASAAKPIFRSAIDKMTMQDAMGLTGQTGATDYLKRSAGGAINAELTPLVREALARTGVLEQASKLSALGLSDSSLTEYVVRKTADGIFTYMGREEERLRQNPMGLMKR